MVKNEERPFAKLRANGNQGIISMLEMRPDCEKCGRNLPADIHGAFICSMECTFCANCADKLDELCPNCGGDLLDRPLREGAILAKYPASTERKHKG